MSGLAAILARVRRPTLLVHYSARGPSAFLAAALLTSSLLIAAPLEARAETANEEAEARALFEEGEAAYRAGELERALERWTLAYERSGRPALLYNLAQVYARLDRLVEERNALERYLAAEGVDEDGADRIPEGIRENIEARLRLIDHRLAISREFGADELTEEERQADPRELFRDGERHYHGGRYEEALSAWLLAYQLSGRTALLYNLAQAYSRLGMLEEEKATLEAFLSDTDEGAVNETLTQSATERLEAIVDRLERTRLEIVGSLDDAEIFLNEEYIGRLPLDGPIKVSPTTHRISGRAEGFADAVATVSMRPGMTSRVELHFEALEIMSERKMKKLPLSLLISGASVAAVGAVVGGLAYGQANGAGINTPEGDRALRMARGADTLLAVGAATFISGIITHIVQKKRASADDDEISIAPSADGLTLGYGRRF